MERTLVELIPAPPVEPSTMTRVPEGSSRTERECMCPASTSGTDPSSGGTAAGSWTAATATGRSTCPAFQVWTRASRRAPARTSGSGDPSPVSAGAGEDADAPGLRPGEEVADAPAVTDADGRLDGDDESAMGAFVSGVKRASPMPANTMPFTSRTSPSSTTAFGFWATACWVRLESWLPRTKTYGTPTSLIRDRVDDSTSVPQVVMSPVSTT